MADPFVNTQEWLKSEQIWFVGPQGGVLSIQLPDTNNTLFKADDLCSL